MMKMGKLPVRLPSYGGGAAVVEIKDVKYSSPDAFALVLQSLPDADAINMARMFIGIHDYFTEIFNSDNITVGKVATILNDPGIATSKVAEIFNNPKIAASRIHSILSNVSITANRVQAILYQMADLGYVGKLNDIITTTAPDVSFTANTTVTGIVRYRNVSIASGVTLTVDGQPGVIIAYNLTNNGTITKTATGGAGGAPGGGVGRGGAGGGGLIIVANEVHYGTYNANGANGENGTTTNVSTGGSAGGGGAMIRVGTNAPGNGGKGGSFAPETEGRGGAPGAGGGGGATQCGGAGGAVTLTTINSYSTIFAEVLKQAADWYAVNVLGKTPTTTKSFYNVYGAGGGGGGDADTYSDGGGGGGSGGQIIVSVNVINGGTFNANGGKGGNGGTEGASDSGGGGGGGGIVYVLYKTLVASPTLNASGGAGGTGDYNGSAGTAGTALAIAV
ncbi:MAG: hypothetical protein QXX41_15185 [Nitrososphaerota archaeon]